MPDEYLVKTHIFEGPLDTLLSLIEKRKLFINDISLAQVADDYISYIKSLKDFPIADSSHFILIASTLVLIKSKSLLPDLALTPEEEENIHDLEDRLKQYQKYKALSQHLKERFGINVEYLRLPSKEKKIVFTPDKNTSVSRILETVNVLIQNLPKKEIVPKAIVQKVISLEEMMESLSERITKSFKMSFKDFSLNHSAGQNGRASARSALAGLTQEQKVNVIVSFLAMLELVKQGIINVRQDADFHDIHMETEQVGVPRY
ncbi:MAG: segregation and condensation protein A [Parcubacteria group bacterium Gr01-1014_46]|nr:MAG: segregation and condensation protein A [Parcubacteria group bacterium Gr01-1014_46]